jgi:nucleotide-binding universal stress UspA family protein
MKYERILIVADDSPTEIKAVRYGFDLAKQLKSKVGLIGVIEPVSEEGNVDAGVFPDQARHQAKKRMKEFLHNLKKDYAGKVPTEIFAPEGEIHDVILQMSNELGAQLIVAGTHCRKGLSRLMMGSMAEGILRDSHIPVFIVPKDKDV